MRYLESRTLDNGATVEIVRELVREDGSTYRHAHHFSADCLSIRAGEYGLDPITDYEAVLDILLNEQEAEPDDEVLPPIVTAATLEEARDTVLARCRAVRDRQYQRPRAKAARTTAAADEAHVEVLDSLPRLFVQDRQLAVLARIHMKAAVRAERERQGAPTISHKARLIDEIREREGI